MKVFDPELRRQRLLVVGRSGYGKSYAAKASGVEPELQAGTRTGIWDPTNAWHGLRKKPDGVRDAFPLVIFGGPHGDMPINEDSGALIGKTLANASESWIITLRDMKSPRSRRRFAADFFEALYDHNSAPLLLVVDEADTVAPEKANDGHDSRSAEMLEEIVKRGRLRGFTPWLITQRPADLAKSCTSQADAIVAMSLTLPHDKDAILKYVKDHDELGTARDLFKQMPKLPKGEGILWWPAGEVLERRKFPKSVTFDSGKPPEAGAAKIKLKPLKVESLAKALDAVVKDAEANDPEKLRARIAELEKAAGAKPAGASVDELRQARAAAYAGGLFEGYTEALRTMGPILDAVRTAHRHIETQTEKAKTRAEELRQASGKAAVVALKPNNNESRPPTAAEVARKINNGIRREAREESGLESRQRQQAALNGSTPSALAKGPHALLKVLAQYAPSALDATRLGMIAGYSGKGGTFGVYMRSLKSVGYVEQSGDGFRITNAGEANVGPFDPLPTGAALLKHWLDKLDKGPAAILQAVADAGGTISAEEAGQVAGYSSSGGTFGVYARKLRALQLVSGTTMLELQEDLR